MKPEAHIDWQIFLALLEIAFNKPVNRKKMGRPPFDKTFTFKILILQSLYSLSNDQMEYRSTGLLDWLSLKRFLKLKSSDKVPDSKTIRKFRETLIDEGDGGQRFFADSARIGQEASIE